MPRTSTTFRPGESKGRPKGAKDKFPRSARHAVTALLEDFAGNVDLIRTTLERGLQARPPASFPYLKLIVEAQIGQPDQTLHLDMAETLKRKVVYNIAPGPTKDAS